MGRGVPGEGGGVKLELNRRSDLRRDMYIHIAKLPVTDIPRLQA